MKLTTIILGAMATIAMGSPVAVSQDESPATNMAAVDTASIAAYCKQCDAFFTKCMGVSDFPRTEQDVVVWYVYMLIDLNYIVDRMLVQPLRLLHHVRRRHLPGLQRRLQAQLQLQQVLDGHCAASLPLSPWRLVCLMGGTQRYLVRRHD